MSRQGDPATGAIELPRSMWKLIEEFVSVSERDEIRQVLGEAAVDLSLDLHAEVAILMEIWHEMKEGQALAHSQDPMSVLLEPATIKSLLRHDIQLLLLNIQKKALDEGSLVFNMEDLKDKLNIQNIDDIVLHLQSILQEECSILNKCILFLQKSLEEEHLSNSELVAINKEPSIAELKEERKILERDLLLTSSIQNLALPSILSGPTSSQVSYRNIEPLSGGPADLTRRIPFLPLSSGRSEANLESCMKLHSPSESGSWVYPIKPERLSTLPYRTSLMPLSEPNCQIDGTPNAYAPFHSKVKVQSKLQTHALGVESRTLSMTEMFPTCGTTPIEELSSLQNEMQMSLMCAEATNELPIEPLLTSSLGHTEIHRSTEKPRTLPSRLRSPTEVLPSRAKLEGHILIPAPPSSEKPINAQPISGRRVRRAHTDSLTGTA
ncbi:coiled-coil domain-containing protein 24 isoform X2 [Callorhinchus milii]|uniref:coiled-coil domain-containing protein 24 isoform X2 n=1 Tax=Callorhinchus milii TaxID=7868 RepID=UPI001C3FC8C2|nr:coiled-coil domain-containing protein 24 isoform X2 [Callorhinchus milii]